MIMVPKAVDFKILERFDKDLNLYDYYEIVYYTPREQK